MIHAIEIATGSSNQDRAAVVEVPGGLLIVLADGAGGTGNGAFAAQTIVDRAIANATELDWVSFLLDLDGELAGGQTTAVILSVTDQITGASVGDSGAWLVRDGDTVELTEGQVRKPLVGDGCSPLFIPPTPFDGTLVVASDGLFRYAKRADIERLAQSQHLATAAKALVELVRLPDGSLQDDVSVVMCRR